ncbi:glycoside hydrolase [Sodiomyces alkalinus F11]|uniref:non-reducing end alpha-L-arabinofuranosidase n=1 Tax=Sodiomyces alkalinus (strain CBS 110278 / VKM F-3762 / F11) TaxID=1314773 RepID=A0A3N2Q7P8_SODAK|nr:glycoside hydrolase [Sodiomyces alkalinus F11]ROT42655.1 glycoside hydrolase [Sodiomyces alkalinus F11]
MPFLKSALAAAALAVSSAAAWDIKVSSSGGNATSGHQYGFLHEDINNSGDGGIYAELIRNRAFQYSEAYPVSLDGWHSVNGAELKLNRLELPLSDALPVSVNVAADTCDSGPVGMANDGYWGMDVKVQKYTGSFWVHGSYEGNFTASLQSALTDEVFGSVEIVSQSVADDWVEHEFELIPETDAPNSNNTFAITFDPEGTADGSLDFNLISLFPPTYKDRKNGLRVDLAQVLADLHPTIIRLPGGNMLEGLDNRTWWDWKDTLGPLRYRPGFQGVWGYQQTHGLGLLEYLQWAEDFDLEIVVGVFAGLALNGDITPPEKLQPFIDDALDQIEFIIGPPDSEWGSVRASLGHPEPFRLLYVEIGNEDWLAGGEAGWQSYMDYRLPMFQAAVNEAYPQLQVIASGSTHEGLEIPEGVLGDYHPYRTPDELVEEFDKFDNDVAHIIGEVAATHPNGGIGWDGELFTFPWWIGTVGEAISMIGYERNADRIPATFYAPILRNMNRWQWAMTMVQHAADPAMTTRSTSWYLWELIAAHIMTHTLPAEGDIGPLYYVAGKNEDKGSFIWKGAAYNTTDSAPIPVSLSFEGVEEGTKALLTMLTNAEEDKDPYAYNDPHLGNNAVERTTFVLTANEEGAFEFDMPELSIAILDTDLNCPNPSKRKRALKN